MKKILSFILLGLLCSIGTWAENATFTMSSIFDGTNQTASLTSPVNATVSTTATKGNAHDGKIGSDGQYFEVVLIDRTFTAASINGYINTTSTDKNWGFQFSTDGGANWATEVTQANDGNKTAHDIAVGATIPSGANGFRVYRRAGTSTLVYSITLTLNATTAPSITTDLSSSAAVTVGIAQSFSIVAPSASSYQWYSNTTNSTEGAIAIDGATSATYSYTAEAEGTIYLYCVATNAAGSTTSSICAVTATNPPAVTAVSILGATSAYNGIGTTYTATAENATTFAWYVNGSIQVGQTSATFVYTPNAVGSHSIYCTATNNFTATPVQSNTINVSVNTPYGEIIKATLNGGNSANMTGVIGGTFDSNLGSGKYKLDKGVYVGIQLASGTFQEGDTVIISMTTAGANYPCLFGDKDKTILLYLATEVSEALEYRIILPAAASGLNTLYLVRDGDDATYKWNPVLSAISVARPRTIVSSVSTLTSVTINSEAISASDLATIQSAGHTVTVANSYISAPVVVFNEHQVVTYEDASIANKDVEHEVLASEVDGFWQAQATINEVTYTLKAGIQAAIKHHVTYNWGTHTEIPDSILPVQADVAETVAFTTATPNDRVKFGFNGWSDGVNTYDSSAEYTMSTSDVAFTAQWNEVAQTSISAATIWDWANAGSSSHQLGEDTYPSNATEFVLANLSDIPNAANFNSQALKVVAQFANRGNNHYFQGNVIKFTTTVPGTVKVWFQNTSNRSDSQANRRFVYVNENNSNVYSLRQDEWAETPYMAVEAGEVTINAYTGEENSTMIRIKKIVFTPTEITLGEGGYSTYSAPFKYSVSGAEVYMAWPDAEQNATKVVLTKVNDGIVPAEEGVVLKGTAGATVTITPTDAAASDFDEEANMLMGTAAGPADASVGTYMYVLATIGGVTAFYPCGNITIPMNKAWMTIHPAATAPDAIRIEFAENNATDIKSIEGSEKAVKFIENGKLYILREGVVYDVTGAMVK